MFLSISYWYLTESDKAARINERRMEAGRTRSNSLGGTRLVEQLTPTKWAMPSLNSKRLTRNMLKA